MIINGFLNKHMTTSTGRKICPECKGNGHLITEMNTIVQCLNCWSEGEIDEKIWARDYTPVIPDELQSTRKKD
jgi:DnaJ-class molecular chaperone